MNRCIESEMCFVDGETSQHSLECAKYQQLVVLGEKFLVELEDQHGCICGRAIEDQAHDETCWAYRTTLSDAMASIKIRLSDLHVLYRNLFAA